MEEISPKRPREEESHENTVSINSNLEGTKSTSKRQKPYNNILDLLDEEEPEPEPEPSQDLSALFTTFQQELSSSSTSCDSTTTTFDFDSLPSAAEMETVQPPSSTDEDESVKSVMRHLLEASDDELGIPNARDDNGVENFNSGENFPFALTDDNGLWELDDVTANYYTVLQSQLFMQ